MFDTSNAVSMPLLQKEQQEALWLHNFLLAATLDCQWENGENSHLWFLQGAVDNHVLSKTRYQTKRIEKDGLELELKWQEDFLLSCDEEWVPEWVVCSVKATNWAVYAYCHLSSQTYDVRVHGKSDDAMQWLQTMQETHGRFSLHLRGKGLFDPVMDEHIRSFQEPLMKAQSDWVRIAVNSIRNSLSKHIVYKTYAPESKEVLTFYEDTFDDLCDEGYTRETTFLVHDDWFIHMVDNSDGHGYKVPFAYFRNVEDAVRFRFRV